MATIEIDGKSFDVENGKMIIEVADDAGIHIPRFCYHKKLSVAANCRMCLVEVVNSKKTLPACATPITDGMKVLTQSEAARRSQEAIMEFLLINHPLDCPICDQGGECELQDVSMGFGADSSEYAEPKRVVHDDDLGTLVATEMTRCIQCTRCVRFGDEIAGLQELGGMGRGEDMQIGTYVEHSLKSEVSANIIDLCPVGALTSKPYRFTARAWEMTQHASVAPHDCLGSNTFCHTRRGELMRVVPKEHEALNETWLSDRDRFSYLGLNLKGARLTEPMIKREGQWEVVDWQTALTFAAEGMSRVIEAHGPEQCAAFSHPSSTLEEMYLLQKLMRGLGVQNLDHRLQATDHRDQALQPMMPTSSLPYQALEQQESVLLLGSNLLREVPLAGVRLRKAQQNGGDVYTMNPVDYDLCMPVTDAITVSPNEMVLQLGALLSVLDDKKTDTVLPKALEKLLATAETKDKRIKALAKVLKKPKSVIVTGALFDNHPEAALLRTLVTWICTLSGAKHLHLTTGANSAGGWLAGMIPHREALGKALETSGLSLQEALQAKLKAYVLMGLDPSLDIANPSHTRQAMLAAEFVVALTGYQTESILECADVILPMALPGETSGTYINVDKTWQTVAGTVAPLGAARPAWKILRVLGNILHFKDFDYTSSQDVLKQIETDLALVDSPKESCFYPEALPIADESLVRVGEWPLYRVDPMVRHAGALQSCAAADKASVRIHPTTATQFDLGETATVSQGDIEITLPLECDERIAPGVVWVACAMSETVDLGHAFASITIKR
ncbi:MAG: NADH-quinone oxidoreductase subunit NuoG [Gammaproteobacteria bacterium]|nr:NADH-quinone oxidoreductase subunit NuoG [Gammaproteobacteria bacterium]